MVRSAVGGRGKAVQFQKRAESECKGSARRKGVKATKEREDVLNAMGEIRGIRSMGGARGREGVSRYC